MTFLALGMGSDGCRGFDRHCLPRLAFVLDFIAESDNKFPVFAGQVLVGRLGCGLGLACKLSGSGLLTDDIVVGVWLGTSKHEIESKVKCDCAVTQLCSQSPRWLKVKNIYSICPSPPLIAACSSSQFPTLGRTRKGEKGIGDGSCSYGLEDGEDLMMSSWNGTIIGPGHVRPRQAVILVLTIFVDCPREPDLQSPDLLWRTLS